MNLLLIIFWSIYANDISGNLVGISLESSSYKEKALVII